MNEETNIPEPRTKLTAKLLRYFVINKLCTENLQKVLDSAKELSSTHTLVIGGIVTRGEKEIVNPETKKIISKQEILKMESEVSEKSGIKFTDKNLYASFVYYKICKYFTEEKICEYLAHTNEEIDAEFEWMRKNECDYAIRRMLGG